MPNMELNRMAKSKSKFCLYNNANLELFVLLGLIPTSYQNDGMTKNSSIYIIYKILKWKYWYSKLKPSPIPIENAGDVFSKKCVT